MTDTIPSIVFEQCRDALICVSAAGRVTALNSAAVKMLGYDSAQVLGGPASMLTDDAHAPQLQAMLARACRGEEIPEQKLCLRHYDGSAVSVLMTCVPAGTSSGGLSDALLICRDTIRAQQVEKKLREQQQQLLQAAKMAALGTLVAGIAHEINNPVNLMLLHNALFQKLWTDLKPLVAEKAAADPRRTFAGLSGDYVLENVDRHLADMQQATGRILKIIEGLKNFSRKANPEERRPVAVNACVANAVRLAETTMRKASIKLEMRLSENLPEINANQGQIEQVLLNLIINAIQAIDHDAGAITIRTSALAGDTMVCVAVEDNGRGIDPEVQDKIFDPFFTDKQSAGGTGLGLSIAYNVVNEHGGKIEVTSKKACGSTFRILLPTVLHEKPVRVLVADDEESMRTSIAKALSRSSRFITETAAGGYEACVKLGTFRPDILVLDLVMPEMNGLEVCRVIRSEPALANMHVLIMTGYQTSQLLDEIRSLGFTDIMTKPFKLGDMVRMIEEKAKGG